MADHIPLYLLIRLPQSEEERQDVWLVLAGLPRSIAAVIASARPRQMKQIALYALSAGLFQKTNTPVILDDLCYSHSNNSCMQIDCGLITSIPLYCSLSQDE